MRAAIRLLLGPVLLWQGARVRRDILRLPEPEGPRQGGQGGLRILILGDFNDLPGSPPYLATVGEAPDLFITKNNFRNVPSGLVQDDPLRAIGLGQPPQFFMK